MKSLIKYLLFLSLMLLFSCDKKPILVSCTDCTTDEPETAAIEISVDKSFLVDNTGILINIYSGNLEDNVLLKTLSATGIDLTYKVTLNKKYTVTATYNIKGGTYIAVDSIIPRVRFVSDQCADPFYLVYDNKVNLKLKYTGIMKSKNKMLQDHFFLACY
jgi:hypothetical protein